MDEGNDYANEEQETNMSPIQKKDMINQTQELAVNNSIRASNEGSNGLRSILPASMDSGKVTVDPAVRSLNQDYNETQGEDSRVYDDTI